MATEVTGKRMLSTTSNSTGAPAVTARCPNGKTSTTATSLLFNSTASATNVTGQAPSIATVWQFLAANATCTRAFAPNVTEEGLTTSLGSLATDAREDGGSRIICGRAAMMNLS